MSVFRALQQRSSSLSTEPKPSRIYDKNFQPANLQALCSTNWSAAVMAGLVFFLVNTSFAVSPDFRIRNSTTKTLEIVTHKKDGSENTFQLSQGNTHELASPSNLGELKVKETGADFLHPWQSVNLSDAQKRFQECGPLEVKVTEKPGLEKGLAFVVTCQK